MSTQKLQVVTPPTPLTSSGSLSTGYSVLAGTFDNSSILAPIVDIGLAVNFTATPTANQILAIYLVPWVNSTNQTTVDTSAPVFPLGTFAGNIKVINGSSTQYLVLPGVPLSAVKYDVYLQDVNATGLSSWTMTFNPTDWQY